MDEKLDEIIDDNLDDLVDSNFKKIKKVLVVDDITYVIRFISKILKDAGYQVISATSGHEALIKYVKYHPDIVTVDQMLPDMTGETLFAKIKELDRENTTKLIFISANYEKEKIKAILNLGVTNYLMKPFTKEKLLEVLKQLDEE